MCVEKHGEAGGFPLRPYAMANATCRDAPRDSNAKPLATRRVFACDRAHLRPRHTPLAYRQLRTACGGGGRGRSQHPARTGARQEESGHRGAVCAEDERRSRSARACRGVRRPRVANPREMCGVPIGTLTLSCLIRGLQPPGYSCGVVSPLLPDGVRGCLRGEGISGCPRRRIRGLRTPGYSCGVVSPLLPDGGGSLPLADVACVERLRHSA